MGFALYPTCSSEKKDFPLSIHPIPFHPLSAANVGSFLRGEAEFLVPGSQSHHLSNHTDISYMMLYDILFEIVT